MCSLCMLAEDWKMLENQSLKYFFFIFAKCVCVLCTHTCSCAMAWLWRSENSLRLLVLLWHWTQVTRFSNNFILSHLSSPWLFCCKGNHLGISVSLNAVIMAIGLGECWSNYKSRLWNSNVKYHSLKVIHSF